MTGESEAYLCCLTIAERRAQAPFCVCACGLNACLSAMILLLLYDFNAALENLGGDIFWTEDNNEQKSLFFLLHSIKIVCMSVCFMCL